MVQLTTTKAQHTDEQLENKPEEVEPIAHEDHAIGRENSAALPTLTVTCATEPTMRWNCDRREDEATLNACREGHEAKICCARRPNGSRSRRVNEVGIPNAAACEEEIARTSHSDKKGTEEEDPELAPEGNPNRSLTKVCTAIGLLMEPPLNGAPTPERRDFKEEGRATEPK